MHETEYHVKPGFIGAAALDLRSRGVRMLTPGLNHASSGCASPSPGPRPRARRTPATTKRTAA